MAAGAFQAWYPFDTTSIDQIMQSLPESASLTAKKGTPVILDSNGQVAACGASPALLYGVLMEDGHNGSAGANNVVVAKIRANDQWVIVLNEALNQNMFGVAAGDLGVVKDGTTNLWYGSTGDAGAQFRIVDYVAIAGGLTFGDTKVPVRGVFHSTKIQVV